MTTTMMCVECCHRAHTEEGCHAVVLPPHGPATQCTCKNNSSRYKVEEEEMGKYGNANCTVSKYDYYAVPGEGGRRVAARFSIGKVKYGTNNWKHGNVSFILERFNHLEEHLRLLKKEGNGADDNLGAMLWAGYCLAWYEENKPEMWAEALEIIGGDKRMPPTKV